MSLARAFFYAGAKSIVPTLWSIDDSGTKLLMNRFYEYLDTGLPKDLAMQQAKLSMLKSENPRPYYWAAPIVIGDARPLDLNSKGSFFMPFVWFSLAGIVVCFFLVVNIKRKKQ